MLRVMVLNKTEKEIIRKFLMNEGPTRKLCKELMVSHQTLINLTASYIKQLCVLGEINIPELKIGVKNGKI